ncbi:MAG: hypothetical protein JWP81_5220 [Ferruginibacter sp.]|nr:hypothetical protein [Ferruginibacter sp.]
MKKTFTLAAIAALITTATFAQNGHSRDNNYDRGRDVVVNNDRDGYGYGKERGTYYFSARERDMQVFSINREYSNKIESVRNRLFMGRGKKEHLIYSLELQRNAEIRGVMAKFNDRRNLFNRDNGRGGRDRRSNW